MGSHFDWSQLQHPKALADALSSNVCWARVKGYPYWPVSTRAVCMHGASITCVYNVAFAHVGEKRMLACGWAQASRFMCQGSRLCGSCSPCQSVVQQGDKPA
eukprot:546729-Pelagomonas_calceolata.AAC.4